MADGRMVRVTIDPVVLVHGPGWPVAPAEAIARLLEAIERDPDVTIAILVRPQTDTLKSVDRSELVTGTLDRVGYRAVLSPIAVRPARLGALFRASGAPGGPLPDAADVLRLAHESGHAVTELEA